MQAITKNHSNWHAHLQLEYSKRDSGTVLTRNQHFGPLMVQKALYPEDKSICHSYILHPPGGLVQGDQLQLDIDLLSHSHALITTPAATKFYRCDDKFSQVKQTINVQDDTSLEWLPQESLLFDQSQVKLSTIINLAPKANFIGWEMLCLGRKASDENYRSGSCRQFFEVWRNEAPLYIERSHLIGGEEMMSKAWGLNNQPLAATMLATGCDKQILAKVQTKINSLDDKSHLSVTLKEDLLICRFLGEQAEKARKAFIEVWSIIRPETLGYEVHIPRIWST